MITSIKLSEKYTIYRSSDDNFKNIKEECLRLVKINDQLVIQPKSGVKQNSIWFEIISPHFIEINGKIKRYIEEMIKTS